MAGGKGERLNPLTRDRAKPAVPFGGIYRIIDFTLSNCVNSGLRRIYVLIQYKSFSLQKHILAGWDVVSTQLGEFIDVIPAQQRLNADWYKGTADAIYQNSYAIQDLDPELVLILAGDHVYKMNYYKMIELHREMKSDVTVACIKMPKETSVNFGVIEVDKKNRVTGFQEKPTEPETVPGESDKIFASMGIYLFSKDILLEELEKDAKDSSSEHDFGKNVIPKMLKTKRNVYAYSFAHENGEPKYWRDIGTRDAYYQANMDLVKPNSEFDLYDRQWPVRTFHEQYPPIKIINTRENAKDTKGSIVDSIVAGGCVIDGADVSQSVLSSNVKIESNAVVHASVLMEGVTVGKNAKIKNAIIDKEVEVKPNAKIGYDIEADRKKFDVTTSGIVIVSKRRKIEPE
jgi:glucose-1-phosphate adenylyltransferase